MQKEHITCSIESLSSKAEIVQCCYICSAVVKTKSNLKAHLIKTHKIVESANDEAFLRKKKSSLHRIYHCPAENCRYSISKGKGVNKFSVLKQHYNWVHLPHNFTCMSCSKTFGTAPALKYHEKKCGVRFACQICGSDFSEQKFLTYHNNKVHLKKDGVSLSDKSTNYEPTLRAPEFSPVTQVLQPIYIPIFVSMNEFDSNMIGSMQESTKSSIELLHKLRLLRPDTKDQSTQIEPQTCYTNTNNNDTKCMPGMCAPVMTMPHMINNNNLINCMPYNWPNNNQPSFYDDDNSRMYMSQCNASMQTVSHHYDNFYNVETQTNLAGFVGRDFECSYGTLPNEDLISSFLSDPTGMMLNNNADELLKLSDNHTQTAKYMMDFVDLSDIETQTNLQELDDLLFKN